MLPDMQNELINPETRLVNGVLPADMTQTAE